MDSATKVIGIGSHQGDDRAGWIVAERLQRRAHLPARVVTLRNPMRLLDQLSDCDRLILIDACSGGDTPGTVKRLEWPDARLCGSVGTSTHGLALVEVLQLAERLERLPREVVLFVIEGDQFAPDRSLGNATLAGLDQLEALVLAEINRLRDIEAPDS
jgi:hydrogenase maturation protease